jgi:hypothetical protein
MMYMRGARGQFLLPVPAAAGLAINVHAGHAFTSWSGAPDRLDSLFRPGRAPNS